MSNLTCPFCGGIVRPHIGHAEITFFACHGCGSVTSFGNLMDEDKPLSTDRAMKLYQRRESDE